MGLRNHFREVAGIDVSVNMSCQTLDRQTGVRCGPKGYAHFFFYIQLYYWEFKKEKNLILQIIFRKRCQYKNWNKNKTTYRRFGCTSRNLVEALCLICVPWLTLARRAKLSDLTYLTPFLCLVVSYPFIETWGFLNCHFFYKLKPWFSRLGKGRRPQHLNLELRDQFS